MGKAKFKKKIKSYLTEEDKKIGRHHLYILIAMIVIGIAAALYSMK